MRPTENQRRCIQDTFGVPTVIRAGAGSGKTATLTRRIVYALEHPEKSGVHDIEQILCITFTRKAAGELKSRIKSALQQAAAARPDAAVFMNEQALKVDGAWISTINGMCSRIIRENAFLLQVDPRFSVFADDARAEMLASVLEKTIAQAKFADTHGRMRALFREYAPSEVTLSLEQLVDMAAPMGKSVRESVQLASKSTSSLSRLLQDFATVVADIYRITFDFNEKRKSPSKSALAWMEAVQMAFCREGVRLGVAESALAEERLNPAFLTALCARLDCVADDEAGRACAQRFVNSFPLLDGRIAPHAPKNNWTVCFDGADVLLAQAYYAAAFRVAQVARAANLDTLIDLADAAAVRFSSEKRAAGVLDNNDFLALTARLLDTEPQVRKRYAERFRLVMVDEFQDTDQVQLDIVNRLAQPRTPQAGKPCGKVCVVGDAQQSIYRFRNADVSVFNDYTRLVDESDAGCVIQLDDNFRSHPDILAFVKKMFAASPDCLDLNPGRSEEYLVRTGRHYKGSAARICVACALGGDAQASRQEAARFIARRFRTLRDEGHDPSEMVVLLGAMSSADVYARALADQGLPCAITGGSVLKKMPDAQLVIDLAYTLVNPLDTARLASVLSSDLFCLNAQELLQLVPLLQDAEGGYHTLAEELMAADAGAPPEFYPQSARLQAALRVLLEAARQVGSMPFSALLYGVLAQSAWLLRMHDGGQTRVANAFKAIRMFETLEEEGLDALTLTRRAQAQLVQAKAAPGVLSVQNDRFVRIMTIHASKGLEFPLVAVAEAESTPPDTARLRKVSRKGAHYVSLADGFSRQRVAGGLWGRAAEKLKAVCFDGNDFAYEESLSILEGKKDAELFSLAAHTVSCVEEEAELWRKIYVAYTRASEALILVPGKRQKKVFEEAFGADLAVCGSDVLEKKVIFPNGTLCDLKVETATWDVGTIPQDPLGHGEGNVASDACATEGFENTDVLLSGQSEEKGVLVFEESVGFPMTARPFSPHHAKGVLSASALMAAHEAGSESLAQTDGAKLAWEPCASQEEDGEGVCLFGDDDDDALACADVAPKGAASCKGDDGADGPLGVLATDRGSAFHALAQWAVQHRLPDGRFAVLPQHRAETIASRFGLDAEAAKGLMENQFRRWMASETAHRVQRCSQVRAEVPFLVPLEGADGRRRTLTGFIDLLAYERKGEGEALVVDYKTGGAALSPAQRREHYLIQARTYAYALLLQGFDSVRLRFVYVDVPGEDGGPFVVEYPDRQGGEERYAIEGLRAFLQSVSEGH